MPRIIWVRTKGKRVCRWVENQRYFPEPVVVFKLRGRARSSQSGFCGSRGKVRILSLLNDREKNS